MQTGSIPAEEQTLHLVTVFILAGKMTYNRQPHGLNLYPQNLRREGGMAAGVFSYTHRPQPPVSRCLPGQLQNTILAMTVTGPVRYQLKGQSELSRII